MLMKKEKMKKFVILAIMSFFIVASTLGIASGKFDHALIIQLVWPFIYVVVKANSQMDADVKFTGEKLLAFFWCEVAGIAVYYISDLIIFLNQKIFINSSIDGIMAIAKSWGMVQIFLVSVYMTICMWIKFVKSTSNR